jgi:TetR/AcrR family transcriptional regulator, tetracycline repressor protein
MGTMTDRVTQGDIVDTALALLAAGGLHALAMRRIAAELGVQQSALYWHFDNKQQLLAAVADRIVAPVEADTGRNWRRRVETLASRLRTELLRFPDGAELVATTIAFRLGAHQPSRQLAAELERAGLSAADAKVAASVLLHFVLGYTTDEQQHHQAAALGAIERDQGHAGHAGHAGGVGEPGAGASADDRFLAGVRLIVAGVAVQVGGRSPRP